MVSLSCRNDATAAAAQPAMTNSAVTWPLRSFTFSRVSLDAVSDGASRSLPSRPYSGTSSPSRSNSQAATWPLWHHGERVKSGIFWLADALYSSMPASVNADAPKMTGRALNRHELARIATANWSLRIHLRLHDR